MAGRVDADRAGNAADDRERDRDLLRVVDSEPVRRLWVAALAAAALVAVVALALGRLTAFARAAAAAVVESGVPGVIVRLRDGEQVRELAKGEASVDDRFRIGSVTKTFVAALTLDLADLGILSLDETVADFEPDLVRMRTRSRSVSSSRTGPASSTTPPIRRSCAASSILALSSGSRTESRAHRVRVLEHELPRPRHRPPACRPRRPRPDAAAADPRAVGPRRHDLRARRRRGPASPRPRAAAAGRHRDREPDGHERPHGEVGVGGRGDGVDGGRSRPLLHALARRRPRTAHGPAGRTATGSGWRVSTPSAARSSAIPATCSARSPSFGRAGDRVLVVAANVFPLTPEQETALQLLLERAFCG